MGPALGRCDRIGDPAGGVVDPAVDDPLLVLAGGRDLGLAAPAGPHPAERRVAMDLDLVLVDQDLGSVGPEGPFLRASSSPLARWNSASSRLPLIVCFGRWMENPS